MDQYLYDTSVTNAKFGGVVSAWIVDGFPLRVEGGYTMVRDQRTLPEEDDLPEDILLQQRELATDYASSSSTAFPDTLGTLFVNVVDTRS